MLENNLYNTKKEVLTLTFIFKFFNPLFSKLLIL